MTGSSQPEWQRSSIGITPLTVRPRPGSRRVKKFDVVGTGTARAEKQAINGAQVNIIFPGIGDRGGEGGAEGGGSSGSRQAAAGRVCSVCTRASADYSCPRCLIGYCSSKCYKVRHHCSSSCLCNNELCIYQYTTAVPTCFQYQLSAVYVSGFLFTSVGCHVICEGRPLQRVSRKRSIVLVALSGDCFAMGVEKREGTLFRCFASLWMRKNLTTAVTSTTAPAVPGGRRTVPFSDRPWTTPCIPWCMKIFFHQRSRQGPQKHKIIPLRT